MQRRGVSPFPECPAGPRSCPTERLQSRYEIVSPGGGSAAACWGRRKRCGQGVAAGLVEPKGRLNFLSASVDHAVAWHGASGHPF